MSHGSVTHGYKFIEKANCEKVGKRLLRIVKTGMFSCKKKRIDTKNKMI
jgi:hypothetical protein